MFHLFMWIVSLFLFSCTSGSDLSSGEGSLLVGDCFSDPEDGKEDESIRKKIKAAREHSTNRSSKSQDKIDDKQQVLEEVMAGVNNVIKRHASIEVPGLLSVPTPRPLTPAPTAISFPCTLPIRPFVSAHYHIQNRGTVDMPIFEGDVVDIKVDDFRIMEDCIYLEGRIKVLRREVAALRLEGVELRARAEAMLLSVASWADEQDSDYGYGSGVVVDSCGTGELLGLGSDSVCGVTSGEGAEVRKGEVLFFQFLVYLPISDERRVALLVAELNLHGLACPVDDSDSYLGSVSDMLMCGSDHISTVGGVPLNFWEKQGVDICRHLLVTDRPLNPDTAVRARREVKFSNLCVDFCFVMASYLPVFGFRISPIVHDCCTCSFVVVFFVKIETFHIDVKQINTLSTRGGLRLSWSCCGFGVDGRLVVLRDLSDLDGLRSLSFGGCLRLFVFCDAPDLSVCGVSLFIVVSSLVFRSIIDTLGFMIEGRVGENCICLCMVKLLFDRFEVWRPSYGKVSEFASRCIRLKRSNEPLIVALSYLGVFDYYVVRLYETCFSDYFDSLYSFIDSVMLLYDYLVSFSRFLKCPIEVPVVLYSNFYPLFVNLSYLSSFCIDIASLVEFDYYLYLCRYSSKLRAFESKVELLYDENIAKHDYRLLHSRLIDIRSAISLFDGFGEFWVKVRFVVGLCGRWGF